MRILATLLALAAVPSAARPCEGTWNLVLDRPGMLPREAAGRLVLDAKGGTLAFDVVLYARTPLPCPYGALPRAAAGERREREQACCSLGCAARG